MTTFDLLAAIARTPSAAFYLAHKTDFQQHVEKPLQAALHQAASLLPRIMRDRLETERNIFSRFIKNDFGRGGAWANYWGAFYPIGSRRLYDLQLALWMNAQRVGISFYIGDYAQIPRRRFEDNCSRYRERLVKLLPDLTADNRFHIARDGRTVYDELGRMVPEQAMSWQEFFANPRAANDWVFSSLTPDEVLSMTPGELPQLTAEMLEKLFPLAVLAMDDEPIEFIRSYII